MLQGVFWIIYSTLDILSELAIFALSVILIVSIHMQLSRKVAIVLCFAPRLLVVATVVIRLIWLYPITLHDNLHHRAPKMAIVSEIEICLSIVTASIPFMVPFFKSLGSKRQRPSSSKPPRNTPNKGTGRTKLPLWFRRQYKHRDLETWKPAAAGAAGYELLPKASPRILSLGSIAPLSSRLQYSTQRKSSIRDFIIRVPHRESLSKQSSELVTPRTYSSSFISTMNESSEALLLHSFIPSRRAPNPPNKMHLLSPPTPGSWHSSHSPPPIRDTPHKPQFSLFPPQRSVPAHAQHPKLCTKALLAPKLSTSDNDNTRPASTQDLTSPMGRAMNSWFSSAEAEPGAQSSAQPPMGSENPRNPNTSSPSQLPDMPMYPLVTHTRSPTGANSFFDELSPPHDRWYTPRSPEDTSMPLVQDVRNHPRVIFRNVL